MKVLIIDNEIHLRTGIRLMLENFCPEVNNITEASGVQDGLTKLGKYKPDVLLLDIEMDDGTGFDLLKEIKESSFQVIFITAHNKYAIEAFKFSAIDYLLKPVDPEALHKSIQKAVAMIRNNNLHEQVQILLQQLSGIQNKDRKIVLKDIENTWFVKINDILYCEAEGTYTRFFLQNKEPILVSKNLKEFEEILGPLGFLRTHHSFLANADKIKSYDKTDGGALIFENGKTIPISQRKKELVLQTLEKRL